MKNTGIQLISAPSILGLAPAGVQDLAGCLLDVGLEKRFAHSIPVLHVPTLNHLYSDHRDADTGCINGKALHDFSLTLNTIISTVLSKPYFPLVLGGDCSILLGILPALKQRGNFGLVFMDAHADFYQAEKSTTGQVADMDLAIATGRGPALLTDILGMPPYVTDEHVLHIGQRDEKEAAQYGSQDIRDTAIRCVSFADIRSKGVDHFLPLFSDHTQDPSIDGCWLHFDTDILDDAINPAVDYRLPGGLHPEEVIRIGRHLIQHGHIIGMSVTIYNPWLDPDGRVGRLIGDCVMSILNK
jgi:arginase